MPEYITHESGRLENGDYVVQVTYILNNLERRALMHYAKDHNISVDEAFELYKQDIQQIVESKINERVAEEFTRAILRKDH